MRWAKTTVRRDEKHIRFGNLAFCVHITRFKGFQCNTSPSPIGTENTVWHHPTWLRLLYYPINKMIDIGMKTIFILINIELVSLGAGLASREKKHPHYDDIIMNAMASQITIVYSIVYSGADQRKHQGSLTFVRGIHRSPVNSQHKGPVTQKMFPFDDVIMEKHSNVHINNSPLQSIHYVCIMVMFTGSS